MTGYAAVCLALAATGLAAGFYAASHLSGAGRSEHQARLMRKAVFCYWGAGALTGIAAIWLLWLILTDQFQYAYVFSYSGRDLPFTYKLSAFWAGQEGSFLLWLVFHTGFGILLVRKKAAPAPVMAVYCVLQAMLLIVLLAKSPFMLLIEAPGDGAGLNPMLQDPWMVIHPPLVFFGYAGLAVPLAFAMGGLLADDHKAWLSQALPWTLFSWAALGAGIFIGGFWAYKVLGWGGYWAWDPVENSSLVPWLFAGALLHIMLVAARRPAGAKAGYLLVIITFVLVLYGTFLTRSGILSDFSTHSFSDEGLGSLLAGLPLFVTVISFVPLIIYWPRLPDGEVYVTVKSREFMLAAGAAALGAFAFLVLVGMSTPLATTLLGSPKSVSSAFYNVTTLPVAGVILLLLVLAPFCRWGEAAVKLKQYWWFVIPGILAAAAGVCQSPGNILIPVCIGLAVMAFFSNLIMAAKHRLTLPAGLAHAGVALMTLGILVSSAGSQSLITRFTQGETQVLFGKAIIYTGTEPTGDGKGFLQMFTIAGPQTATVRSLTKLDKAGRPAAREPGIYREWAADLYVAPLVQGRQAISEVTLHKDERKQQDGLSISLSRLGMKQAQNSQEIRVFAELEIEKDGYSQFAMPEMIVRNEHAQAVPVRLFEQFEIALHAVSPGEGKVILGLRDLTPSGRQAQLEAEISQKPLINLVWLGAFVITTGTAWAGWNRLSAGREVRHTEERRRIC